MADGDCVGPLLLGTALAGSFASVLGPPIGSWVVELLGRSVAVAIGWPLDGAAAGSAAVVVEGTGMPGLDDEVPEAGSEGLKVAVD